jgi:hypothetical protein
MTIADAGSIIDSLLMSILGAYRVGWGGVGGGWGWGGGGRNVCYIYERAQ